MIKKIALVCGIAIALLVLAVTAGLPAHAAGDNTITIKADDFTCPKGEVEVHPNILMHIVKGTASISSCDIILDSNASVFITNATINASGNFDICSPGPCGTNVTVHIFNATIDAGLNVDLQAPGSSSRMLVQYDDINRNTMPAEKINIISDGTTIVHNMFFNASGKITIHGGVKCISGNNTPSTVSCS